MNSWIYCSERLPASNTDVLVSIADVNTGENYVCTDIRIRGSWLNAREGEVIVAWMPLPKPAGER